MAQPGKQSGLSMIEVLVAITILSIGLLGTAALQVQSKRANLGSVERTLASMLVNDMFERMRANPTRFNAYLTRLEPADGIGKGDVSEPSQDCTAAEPCDTNQLVRRDIYEWEQQLIGASEVAGTANTGGLVLPLACMTGPPGGGDGTYTIEINWRGHSEITDGTPTDPCNANGSGRYDGDEGTGTLRRFVSISSYLNDE